MRNQEHHHLRSYGEAAVRTDERPVPYHPSGESKKGEKAAARCRRNYSRAQCYDEGNLRVARSAGGEEDCAEGRTALKLHHIFVENEEIHSHSLRFS